MVKLKTEREREKAHEKNSLWRPHTVDYNKRVANRYWHDVGNRQTTYELWERRSTRPSPSCCSLKWFDLFKTIFWNDFITGYGMKLSNHHDHGWSCAALEWVYKVKGPIKSNYTYRAFLSSSSSNSWTAQEQISFWVFFFSVVMWWKSQVKTQHTTAVHVRRFVDYWWCPREPAKPSRKRTDSSEEVFFSKLKNNCDKCEYW